MRLFKSILVGMTAFLVAGSAAATVTVNHNSASNGATLNLDQTFTVTINLQWDGAVSTLQGIFSSTNYDTSVLQFVSSTTGPASILTATVPDENGDLAPGLNRLLTPQIVNGALRSVQYGAGSATSFIDPSGATAPAGRSMAILTFRAIGAGSSNIAAIIAPGDSGAVGDTFVVGSGVTVNVVPEPGTALLMGLGLAGLGFAGRRK